MISSDRRKVGLLRPIDTCDEKLLGFDMDVETQVVNERLDEIVTSMHALIEEASDRLNLQTEITSYQLHERGPNQSRILSRKRFGYIGEEDVVAALNPSPAEFAFVEGTIKKHPMQRGIVGFTSQRTFDELLSLLAHMKKPIFKKINDGIQLRSIPSVFSLYIPWNTDEENDRWSSSVHTVEQALLFPNVKEMEYNASKRNLVYGDQLSDLERDPKFQKHITGDESPEYS